MEMTNLLPQVAGFAPLLATALLGYLVGSLSSAVMVARARGLPDPRTLGSGNPGATNMLRHAGKKLAAVVLVLDLAKGLLPVLAVQLATHNPALSATCATFACLGHIWPIFFGFRGGKAVATYAGACFGMSVWLGLGFAVVWLGVLRLTRISSLGAITACVSAPMWAWVCNLGNEVLAATVFLSALVIARHHTNIRRLLAGDEGRVGR